MTQATDTRELEKELLAGLEGIAPGPYSTGGDSEHGRDSGCLIWGPKGPGHGTVGAVKPYNNYADHINECRRQAEHFARCSPDNIRALLATIADLRATVAEAGWRTMDSAPKDGSAILGIQIHNGLASDPGIVSWDSFEEEWWDFDADQYGYPTHWQPLRLPQPPATAKHGGSNAE